MADSTYDLKISSLREVVEKSDFAGPPTIDLVARAQRGVRQKGRRLGVFPASFNPITVSHAELIFEAAESASLDEILLVLDKRAMDKEIFGASLEDRLFMLILFSQDSPSISVGLSNKGRFLDKLPPLEKLYPPDTEIFFIVGYDTIARVLDRKYYEDRDSSLDSLFAKSKFLVANRGDKGIDEVHNLFEMEENRRFCDRVDVLKISELTAFISSTKVRDRTKEGKRIGDLVPPQIESFIQRMGLYRASRQ